MDYKEQKEHGSSVFPIELYYMDINHPRYEMVCHWHMEDELLRVLRGNLNITLNERKYCAKKGDLIFISAGILHSAIPDGTDCIYECLVFDMHYISAQVDICHNYIKNITNCSILIKEYFNADKSEFYKIVWELFDTMNNSSFGYQLKVKGLLYQMLASIFKDGLYQNREIQNIQTEKRILKLKDVLAMIEKSYDSVIMLETMSSIAKMSPKYFCNFFKEMTNKTPMEYLINYRIEQACVQLENSELTVTEIAYNCGFNDLSHFIKTFKKLKKITPKKFRKEKKEAASVINNMFITKTQR